MRSMVIRSSRDLYVPLSAIAELAVLVFILGLCAGGALMAVITNY